MTQKDLQSQTLNALASILELERKVKDPAIQNLIDLIRLQGTGDDAVADKKLGK